MSAIKLYTFPLSGHSHRVELFLSLLNIDAELVQVDLAKGEHKTAAFLAMNPAGQIPVLTDGDITLFDSNAILVYLAKKYDAQNKWFPEDLATQVEIHSYFSLAAGKLAYGPANARIINLFGRDLDKEFATETAYNLLDLLEQKLNRSAFLASEQPTLADIAHYTYIAHAPEGDVSLADYPKVIAWLNKIEQLPGFIGMKKSQVGLAKPRLV